MVELPPQIKNEKLDDSNDDPLAIKIKVEGGGNEVITLGLDAVSLFNFCHYLIFLIDIDN